MGLTWERKKEERLKKEQSSYMMDKQTAFDEQQYSNSKVRENNFQANTGWDIRERRKSKYLTGGRKNVLHNWSIYESKLQIFEKEIKMKYM